MSAAPRFLQERLPRKGHERPVAHRPEYESVAATLKQVSEQRVDC
jgi:hypothetical protein